MLYTSYFAMLRNLPKDVVPISICAKAPSWYHGLQYKKLAPKYEFFAQYQKDHDSAAYTKCFQEQVLAGKVPQFILEELKELAGSNSIALICYEKPSDFCHRHIVADWFIKSDILCCEWLPNSTQNHRT